MENLLTHYMYKVERWTFAHRVRVLSLAKRTMADSILARDIDFWMCSVWVYYFISYQFETTEDLAKDIVLSTPVAHAVRYPTAFPKEEFNPIRRL